MNSNVISYALTAYALYNAIVSSRKLKQQQQSIEDIIKSQEDLSNEVESLTTKTANRLNEDIQFTYTLILGRPSSYKKLSGALHFSIKNNSKTNTYTVQAFMFVPKLDVLFCNSAASNLFNLQFGSIELKPGQTFNARLSYNNLKIPETLLGPINDKILALFHDKYMWDKLGDKDETVSGGCEGDVWIRCSAPYLDPSHFYIVEKKGVKGDLRWHGGNYLPGNPDKQMYSDIYYTDYGTVMPFTKAVQMLALYDMTNE